MLTLRKVIRFLDKVTDNIILIFCLIALLMGLYGLYDSYMVYKDSNDTSLLKFKPGYETEEPDKEIKGNMVAWVTLDDTNVDYPIMQGEDNTEYLNKDPYGDYSLAGSIFLDSRNNPDFTDGYSLVYGHHMEHGMMFGALDEFLDEEYFNTHETGTLIVGGDTYHIRIFAVVESEATQEAIFAPTEIDIEDTVSYVSEHALYLNKDNMLKEGERLLGLSTCKYPDTADRTIVFGALTEYKGE